MKAKKLLAALGVALLATALLAGCGGDKKSTSSGNTIKIGANLELTGNSASFGKSSLNGMKLAVKEINAKGGVLGKQLEIVVADNKSEAAEAANAVQKLVSQDKVAAIVGSNLSSSVIAAIPINTGAKTLVITPMGTNPAVTVDAKTGKTNDFMFRAPFIDPFQGTVAANFVSKTLKAKTAVVYIDNSSDYAKGLAQFFKENFEKLGGKVVGSEAYLQKDTDFKATLTKIKALNPDLIYIPGYYQEVGLIIKQARELGMNMTMIGGDGWDSNKLPEIAGKAALEGTYFTNAYSPNDTAESVKSFVAAYQKEYNNEVPDVFAAMSYDSVMLIANAIAKAGAVDNVKIKDAMAATKDFQVATGKVTFDAQHNPVKPAVIIEHKDGKQTFKEKVNP